jgi:hypothetical protein
MFSSLESKFGKEKKKKSQHYFKHRMNATYVSDYYAHGTFSHFLVYVFHFEIILFLFFCERTG